MLGDLINNHDEFETEYGFKMIEAKYIIKLREMQEKMNENPKSKRR